MKSKRVTRLISISMSAAFVLSSLFISASLTPSKMVHAQQQAPKENADSIKVTLLGTGSPLLSMKRFGPSTLVEAGGERLLFDTGRGAALRLSQLNIMPGEIDKLFLTHLHSDHTIGIPDLWLTGSLPSAGKRATELKVWGPAGTKEMMLNLEKAFVEDINVRNKNQNESLRGLTAIGQDIKEGIVYEQNGVQVEAFLVDHKAIEPSYGYRVNYKGHSVVMSGDTRYNENLIRHAQGTDLLIHEVAAAKPDELVPAIQKILDIHTTPEEAGKVFNQVKPKLAVYSHIVLLGSLTDAEAQLAVRTSQFYNGPVVVGEDLMSFEIGTDVKVKEPVFYLEK